MDPLLAQHLAFFGIDFSSLQKVSCYCQTTFEVYYLFKHGIIIGIQCLLHKLLVH